MTPSDIKDKCDNAPEATWCPICKTLTCPRCESTWFRLPGAPDRDIRECTNCKTWWRVPNNRASMPDREELAWAAAALMKVAVAQLLYREKGDDTDHQDIVKVAEFLRSLAGTDGGE